MENNKTYLPTEAIQNNSKRGIGLLSKSKALAASKVIETVKPYSEILKAACSLDDIKKLYVFLVKAEEHYEPLKRIEGNNLTPASAAFMAAGGSSALAWTRMILKQEKILKSYTKEILTEEINKEENIKGISLPISKALNEDLMQATYIVMVPNEVDLHGDITTEEEVRKACHNFNKSTMQANLFHLVETDTFEFAESYLAPTDFILGDKLVTKGTWLCTIQCLDENLWALIKSGDICGVSIGALASVETINED